MLPLAMSDSLLHIKNLSRQRADERGYLLHPTDISIAAGERIAVCGASGSGKSMLLRAIALLDTIDYQNITFLGSDIKDVSIPHYRSQVQLIHQNVTLIEGSVEDNLRFPHTFAVNRNRVATPFDIQGALEFFQLPQRFLQRHSNQLSGGERQIVNLWRSLALSPRILLLDEPSASLDADAALRLEQYVRQWLDDSPNERAYLWVSHHSEQIQRIANVYWHVNAGVLQIQATPVITSPQTIA